MGKAIEIRDLVKSYGEQTVLKSLSFQINQGEIYGILGVNGAGKTTTLECMEGLRSYDSGKIEVKGSFGVQLQSSSLPKNIKVKEVIHLFSKWQKIEVDHSLVEHLGVTPLLSKYYGTLSTGQMRRVHLVLALLGEPDIIFLDEPTAGLDVEGRVQIHEEIRRLKGADKTIVLASHDMAEVEELCDRLFILKDGEIAFEGTVSELKNYKSKGYRLRILVNKELLLEGNPAYYDRDKDYYCVNADKIEDELHKIVEICKEQGASILDVNVQHVGLEQIFMDIAREVKDGRVSI